MTEPAHAVFLSYASQDAEAAKRICGALRAAGIEVWFDQSELRGGDAWDRQIRQQIHDCALFIPVISANTQARLDLLADRDVPRIATPQLALVEPDLDAGCPERLADAPRRLRILRGVAQEHGPDCWRVSAHCDPPRLRADQDALGKRLTATQQSRKAADADRASWLAWRAMGRTASNSCARAARS